MPGGRLTGEDRRLIAEGLAEGLGYTEIGRRLGRPASTVMREVTRNGGPEEYRASRAQEATRQRARRRRQDRPPTSTVPAGGDGRDPQQVQEFTEFFTVLVEQQGLPRMAARALTCLCVTDSGTLTAADLVQRLQVSPASVSQAVNVLEQQGIVRRERAPGERRERYVIDDDIWLRSALAAMRMNGALITASQRGAEILGATTPAGARFGASAEFLLLMSEALQQVMDRWRQRTDARNAERER
ncbi:MarR family transcriptional regulator [Kitasatospora aureofaciens]|uniref:MarR family transcriptional regulator n=1 Tax=Kitasatospora aureofaciens TaxID=1894 RepID=A0A1E7N0F2_KITAU|nr:MarR family transcriptional regulator [Kitasatospora aureofaciens]OEV34170.1 MarR family transcriptional regulator [Kitasatospora aureofaciens]GGU72864.1 MarR family transcriptional regulator [Kitasatospora aureofaciens]